MTAQIEYYEEKSHRFRAVTFAGVKAPTTIEEAAAILTKFKIKFLKIVKFS